MISGILKIIDLSAVWEGNLEAISDFFCGSSHVITKYDGETIKLMALKYKICMSEHANLTTHSLLIAGGAEPNLGQADPRRSAPSAWSVPMSGRPGHRHGIPHLHGWWPNSAPGGIHGKRSPYGCHTVQPTGLFNKIDGMFYRKKDLFYYNPYS